MAGKVTKAQSDADLQRVAEQVGHPPSISEYQEYGRYSVPTVARHYDGSFKQARAAVCGGSAKRQAQYRREELLAEIRRVTEIVAGEPSKDDFHDHGRIALSTITYRFESWMAAKKEAGVYEGGVGVHRTITDVDLTRDLQRVDGIVDGPVTQENYREHGNYSIPLMQRRFGSWEGACREAGVTRPYMGPKDIDNSDVLQDMLRVKQEIGYYPTKSDYNRLGEYSEGIVKVRFGSWMAGLEAAGFDGKPQDGQRNPNWKDEPKYQHYTHPNWKKNRPRALERDSYTCQAPGCTVDREEHLEMYGADLTVHHIRRDDWPDDRAAFHSLENLITFCINHHGQYEKRAADCEGLLKKRRRLFAGFGGRANPGCSRLGLPL